MGEPAYLSTIVPVDEESAATFARQKLLVGRYPDPVRADEVAVNFTVADQYELDVGDTFELDQITQQFAESQPSDSWSAIDPGSVPHRTNTFRVVGIVAGAGDFPPRSLGDGAGNVIFTPAFGDQNPAYVSSYEILAVRLVDGAGDRRAFRAAAERLAGAPFDTFAFDRVADQHASTQRAIDLLAAALWVMTALAGVATVLVLGQALLRLTALEAGEYPRLRALGFTQSQLVGLGLGRGMLIALAGAIGAVALAAAASPLFPLGLARTAEPDPGLKLDASTLLGGAAIVVVVVTVLALLSAWRVARANRPTADVVRQVSRVGATLTRAGAPPPAVAGARMALEAGRGATAVPARSTVIGAVTAIAALVAALTFAAGLERLLETPRLYGWNWDITVGDGYGHDAYDDVVSELSDDPAVSAFGAGTFATVFVEDLEMSVLAIEPIQGAVAPTIVDGRPPSTADELVLGGDTMAEIGVSIGDEVTVAFHSTLEGDVRDAAAPQRFKVVGRGVLPEQSDIGLAEGAAMTYAGLARITAEEPNRNLFPVRLAEGVDRDAALADISDRVSLYAVPLQQPTDLVNFGRVDALPLVGAGLLALVAAAMMTHLLLSSVRRRRRDLALLRTLVFTRSQISFTVAAQATTLAIVALLVGIPLGAAAGRWAWTIAAEGLGVVAEPVLPVLTLLLLIPLTIVAANLVAAAPARLASRTGAAVVLRSERWPPSGTASASSCAPAGPRRWASRCLSDWPGAWSSRRLPAPAAPTPRTTGWSRRPELGTCWSFPTRETTARSIPRMSPVCPWSSRSGTCRRWRCSRPAPTVSGSSSTISRSHSPDPTVRRCSRSDAPTSSRAACPTWTCPRRCCSTPLRPTSSSSERATASKPSY